MSLIICMTGPINSGKSLFCEELRKLEPSSIGFESGQIIAEIANEYNGYVRAEITGYPDEKDLLQAFNKSLSKIQQNRPHLFGEAEDISFDSEDVKAHPEQFTALKQYIETIQANPEILSNRISAENKDLYYRPFLQWLGGYMVYKVSPTVWFDEIGRRVLKFIPTPNLITVNALRYPTDEKAMRAFAAANSLDCLVVEVQRPGVSEGSDVTEASRREIHADTVVMNNGEIEDLAKVAKDLLHDYGRRKLKAEYSAK